MKSKIFDIMARLMVKTRGNAFAPKAWPKKFSQRETFEDIFKKLPKGAPRIMWVPPPTLPEPFIVRRYPCEAVFLFDISGEPLPFLLRVCEWVYANYESSDEFKYVQIKVTNAIKIGVPPGMQTRSVTNRNMISLTPRGVFEAQVRAGYLKIWPSEVYAKDLLNIIMVELTLGSTTVFRVNKKKKSKI